MAQRSVDALDGARPAVELLAEAVLPGREEIGVRPVPVRVDQPALIDPRQESVEFRDSIPAPVADDISQDLPGVARNGSPEPEVSFLANA